jgi:hypothetical protein
VGLPWRKATLWNEQPRLEERKQWRRERVDKPCVGDILRATMQRRLDATRNNSTAQRAHAIV